MSDASSTTPAASNDNVMAAVATIPLVGLIIYFAMPTAGSLVKFYAKQSIGLLLINIVVFVISFVLAFLPYPLNMISCLVPLLGLVEFVLWVVLLINALQGKIMRIPVMSDMIDSILK